MVYLGYDDMQLCTHYPITRTQRATPGHWTTHSVTTSRNNQSLRCRHNILYSPEAVDFKSYNHSTSS